MTFTLDPQIAQVLAALPDPGADATPPAVGDVAARRAVLEGILAHADAGRPFPADVTTTDRHLITADGAKLALRWYAKHGQDGEPGPAAVYYHGGGMILGNIDLVNSTVAGYVSASGVPILSVDYRLAPEHPHPTPSEDAYAGLVWLYEHAAELGVDPARVAVVGESAGGGLAAAVALLARDRQGPPIAGQLLFYPMLDDRNLAPDPYLAGHVGWNWDDNRTGWGALLGDAAGGPGTSPYAAPARAADLAGLPPAYIEVGQLDAFRDEDLTYALRLSQAGVPVEFHLHPGAPHGFDGIAPGADVSQRALADRVRVLAAL
jgi:acetyl esterase/lipase